MDSWKFPVGVLLFLIGFVLFSYLYFFWAKDMPLRDIEFSEDDFKLMPALGFVQSATKEYGVHALKVEGEFPQDLRGVLYRNGPGIYDRGSMRKRCLLDGDGMIQEFRIKNGIVLYRNAFVKTKKFLEEQKAGRFLHETWTTLAPGGFWKNLGFRITKNQAGITVFKRNNRLFAFDEYKDPYELDPITLKTIGLSTLGMEPGFTVLSAHSKIDPVSKEWLFFGLKPGRDTVLHMTLLDKNDELKWHRAYNLPRYNYIHDFFMTENYVIFNFHPVFTNIFSFLAGRHSITGAMEWRPEKENLIMVFKKYSPNNENPLVFQSDAVWMWHSINAYEKEGSIVADFIGYDFPDHFLGDNPALFSIMKGQKGKYKEKGKVRRMIIDVEGKSGVAADIVIDDMYAFPYINQDYMGRRYRYLYAIKMTADPYFFDSVARIDMQTSSEDVFCFGNGIYTSEPVFAPRGQKTTTSPENEGWLLVEIYDSFRQQSALAVFDAANISEGPRGIAWLKDRMPIGFHGTWTHE
jgi:all-trans-8'-apo-beta-carotenal 15,15'-oxygenase